MTTRGHVTVIGGGAVGILTSLSLLRDGHTVRIISNKPVGETTAVGSGGLFATTNVIPLGTLEAIAATSTKMFDPASPMSIDWRYLPRLPR